MSFLFNFPGAQYLNLTSPDLAAQWPGYNNAPVAPQKERSPFGGLASFLPGASDLSDDDRRALVNQGLLAMGAGILANNRGGNGSAAIGQGISQGLLAMNQASAQLAKTRFAQQGGEKPAQQRYLEWLVGQLPEDKRQDAYLIAAGVQGRGSSAGFQTIKFVGQDKRERIGVFNARTGQIETPDGLSFDPSRVTPLGVSTSQPYTIDPRLPPEVQEAIRQSEASGQPLPPQIDLAPAIPRPSQTAGQNPFVGPTPGEVAFDEELAKQSAQLNLAPAFQAIETRGAIDRARGSAQASADVGRQEIDRQRQAALAQYEAARAGVVEGMAGTNTGPLVGRLPALTKDQQIAEGSVAALAPILKQVFRAAGEGVFTDRDQQLLLDMAPKRTDHPEAAAAKLANIDAIIQAKLGAGASAGPRPGMVDSGYRFKGGDPADPRNWEQL